MTDNEPELPPSLIEAAQATSARQPSLFPNFDDQAYEVLEEHGEFTGERLFNRDPRKYRLIVRMLSEGLATRAIARACAVSPNTIEAVRKREGSTVDALKEEILSIVRSAARLCAERVQELAPMMDARDASVAFGIMAEKMLLLTGEATVIIGKEETVKHADFNAMVEALPQANARIVEMGFRAEAPTQTCEPPATLGGTPPVASERVPDGGPAGGSQPAPSAGQSEGLPE